MTTAYVSIGNSDDKLSQADWAEFHAAVDAVIRRVAEVHGAWVSPSTDPWQNACWCIDVTGVSTTWLRNRLVNFALAYQQESIAWAEVQQTEFLRPE